MFSMDLRINYHFRAFRGMGYPTNKIAGPYNYDDLLTCLNLKVWRFK